MARPRTALPPLLLLAGALLAHAGLYQRCTEHAEGLLEGEPHAQDPTVVPAGERRYSVLVPFNETCGVHGARGLLVTACDVLPPQLEARAAAALEWGEVRVLRLGPLWNSLLLELTLFCDPASSATPATPPDAPPRTTTASTGPIAEP